jgi:prephenate dehydratase
MTDMTNPPPSESRAMLQETGWIDVHLTVGQVREVATLGPTGTSSEQAAHYLWADRAAEMPPRIRLYDTYEGAGAALREGTASHLVVANAYSAVNSFYMDPGLSFAGAFLFDTPHYGIAVSPGHRIPAQAVISTHPAPAPLVAELLPGAYSVAEMRFANSTSVAAANASERRTDLALTTARAAEAHALEFISRTRPIRMLWSVFTLRTQPAAAQK